MKNSFLIILMASLLPLTINCMEKSSGVPSLVQLACISLSKAPAIDRVISDLAKYDAIPTDLVQPIVSTILEKNLLMRSFILQITGIKTYSTPIPDNIPMHVNSSKNMEKIIHHGNIIASSDSSGMLALINFFSTPATWTAHPFIQKATCFDMHKNNIVIGNTDGSVQAVSLADINILQRLYTIKIADKAIKIIKINNNLLIALDAQRKLHFIDTKTGAGLFSEDLTIPGKLHSCLFSEDGAILKISTNKVHFLAVLEDLVEVDTSLHKLSVKQIMVLQYLYNQFLSTIKPICLDQLDSRDKLKPIVESFNPRLKEILIKSGFLII